MARSKYDDFVNKSLFIKDIKSSISTTLVGTIKMFDIVHKGTGDMIRRTVLPDSNAAKDQCNKCV